jgi:hypothetical protein
MQEEPQRQPVRPVRPGIARPVLKGAGRAVPFHPQEVPAMQAAATAAVFLALALAACLCLACLGCPDGGLAGLMAPPPEESRLRDARQALAGVEAVVAMDEATVGLAAKDPATVGPDTLAEARARLAHARSLLPRLRQEALEAEEAARAARKAR